MPTSGQSVKSFTDYFKPPDVLKSLYDWRKIGELLLAIFLWAGARFIVDETARVRIGLLIVVSVITLIIAYAMYSAWRGAFLGLLNEVENLCPQNTAVPELRKVYRLESVALAMIGTLFVAMSIWLIANPFYRWWYQRIPQSIGVVDAHFIDTKDAHLLRDSPFLEALKDYLQRKAKAAGDTPNTFVVLSEKLTRPAPSFLFTLRFPHGASEISGYAFRLHTSNGKRLFEPLQSDGTQAGRIEFIFPAAEEGDQVFFIGRSSPSLSASQLSQLEFQLPNKGQ